ncbi:GPI mannosyltransferase-like protein [Sarcoptes scabiei]|uniref:Mannosyltransferase n=1 Tax=Sarcoptes scabiei TaxID=52283 RepID=A0A132AM95_SARSC|nr:GPI mannosyltransferase-like protein [Sarcoptes scabiei]
MDRNKNYVKNQRFYLKIFTKILFAIRILIVLLPQTGYIQPDEFHQFTEPLARKIFNVKTLIVWEFHQDHLLRSMVFPQIFCGLVFKLINYFYSQDPSSISSYGILIVPRLIMALFSFLIDFSLIRIAKLFQMNRRLSQNIPNLIDWLGLIHSSMYLTMTYYNRTFTNTIETVLFSLLLWIVFESISRHHSVKVQSNRTAIYLGMILAAGFFNRPTFAIFAFVPISYWIVMFRFKRNQIPSFWNERIRIVIENVLKLSPSFLMVSIVFIIFDSNFYDRLKWSINLPKLISLDLVITPWNFIRYNIDRDNLSNHGLHPFYFHTLICFPLIFTFLALINYLEWLRLLCKILRNNNRMYALLQFFSPSSSSNNANDDSSSFLIIVLHLTILFSLLGFSLIPHQEPRFLMPLVVAVIVVSGPRLIRIVQSNHTKFFISLWFLTQLPLTIFYGFLHQSGVTQSLLYLRANHHKELYDSKQNITILFNQMYLPPQHLLLLSHSSNVIIKDYSIEPFLSSITSTLNESFEKLRRAERIKLFIILPSYFDQLLQAVIDQLCQINQISDCFLKPLRNFLHFSGENFHQSISLLQGREPEFDLEEYKIFRKQFKISDTKLQKSLERFLSFANKSNRITKLKRAFGMSVWMIDLIHIGANKNGP